MANIQLFTSGTDYIYQAGVDGPYYPIKYFRLSYDPRLDSEVAITPMELSATDPVNSLVPTSNLLYNAHGDYTLSNVETIPYNSGANLVSMNQLEYSIFNSTTFETKLGTEYVNYVVTGENFAYEGSGIWSGSSMVEAAIAPIPSNPDDRSTFFVVDSYSPTLSAYDIARGYFKIRIAPNQGGTFKFNKVYLYATSYDTNGNELTANPPVLIGVVHTGKTIVKSNGGDYIANYELDVQIEFNASGHNSQLYFVNQDNWTRTAPALFNDIPAIWWNGDVSIGDPAVTNSWVANAKLDRTVDVSINNVPVWFSASYPKPIDRKTVYSLTGNKTYNLDSYSGFINEGLYEGGAVDNFVDLTLAKDSDTFGYKRVYKLDFDESSDIGTKISINLERNDIGQLNPLTGFYDWWPAIREIKFEQSVGLNSKSDMSIKCISDPRSELDLHAYDTINILSGTSSFITVNNYDLGCVVIGRDSFSESYQLPTDFFVDEYSVLIHGKTFVTGMSRFSNSITIDENTDVICDSVILRNDASPLYITGVLDVSGSIICNSNITIYNTMTMFNDTYDKEIVFAQQESGELFIYGDVTNINPNIKINGGLYFSDGTNTSGVITADPVTNNVLLLQKTRFADAVVFDTTVSVASLIQLNTLFFTDGLGSDWAYFSWSKYSSYNELKLEGNSANARLNIQQDSANQLRLTAGSTFASIDTSDAVNYPLYFNSKVTMNSEFNVLGTSNFTGNINYKGADLGTWTTLVETGSLSFPYNTYHANNGTKTDISSQVTVWKMSRIGNSIRLSFYITILYVSSATINNVYISLQSSEVSPYLPPISNTNYTYEPWVAIANSSVAGITVKSDNAATYYTYLNIDFITPQVGSLVRLRGEIYFNK